MSRSHLRLVGFLFWVVTSVTLLAATRHRGANVEAGRGTLLGYLLHRSEPVEVIDESGWVRLHDPVFLEAADGRWVQIGHVEGQSSKQPDRFTIAWYAEVQPASQFSLRSYQHDGRIEDVIAVMLPESKRRLIRGRLEGALREHGEQMMQTMVPLVQQSLQRSMPVIEQELMLAIERHADQLDVWFDHWNGELVDKRLVPLARREVMPIVRAHGQPIAETIGRELWDRASIWRFGWRAAYDKSPLPRRDLLQQEWDRFVEEEAIPVFDAHLDEIVAAIQRMIAEIAAKKAIRDDLREVAASMLGDPETIRLIRELAKESIVDNARLHQAWREVWSSEQARHALSLAGERIEPVVRQIGDDLFGSRQGGINPDFARVLRSQILGKDRSWIVAIPEGPSQPGQPVVIRRGDQWMPFPVVYLADPGSLAGAEP